MCHKRHHQTDLSCHFENSCKFGTFHSERSKRNQYFPTSNPVKSGSVLSFSQFLCAMLHTVLTSVFSQLQHPFKGNLSKMAENYNQSSLSHLVLLCWSQHQELALTAKEGSSRRLKRVVSLEIYFFKHGHFEINDTTSGNMKE